MKKKAYNFNGVPIVTLDRVSEGTIMFVPKKNWFRKKKKPRVYKKCSIMA